MTSIGMKTSSCLLRGSMQTLRPQNKQRISIPLKSQGLVQRQTAFTHQLLRPNKRSPVVRKIRKAGLVQAVQDQSEETSEVEKSSVFGSAVDVVFDNESEDKSTVLFVTAENRIGLLYDISAALRYMNVGILDANITTTGTKALDIFKVTTKEGAKIPEESWAEIRKGIQNVVRVGRSEDSPEKILVAEEQQKLSVFISEMMALLTRMIETVVQQHDGEEVVFAANYLMTGFKSLKGKPEPRLHAELMRFIQNTDPALMNKVVRMLNLLSMLLAPVEEYSRQRVRDERLRDLQPGQEGKLWHGSFLEAFSEFKAAGVTPQELQAELNKLEYLPVFTAHPTEARRRVVMMSLRRVYGLLDDLCDPRIGPLARRRLESKLECEVETLWRTDEMRQTKPSVMDEIIQGLSYYQDSLFDATLDMYKRAEDSLARVYGDEEFSFFEESSGDVLRKASLHFPSCIQFGSWIGGDRDGNPFVKPKTTEAAALLQSRVVLVEYIKRVEDASHRLTHSAGLHKIDPAFVEHFERSRIAEIGSHVEGLSTDGVEMYRVFLWVMQHRLEQNLRQVNRKLRQNEEILNHPRGNAVLIDIMFNIDELPGLDPDQDAYADETEFIADLRALEASLLAEGSGRLVDDVVHNLLRLAETFGFYLGQLDIRQESGRHEEAVTELLGEGFLGLSEDYAELDSRARLAKLSDIIQGEPPSHDELAELMSRMTADTRETVEVLQAVAAVKSLVSDKAIGAYCISMAQSADDVLEVLFLAWLVNQDLVKKSEESGWTCRMCVSPLFETIPDLEGMPQALDDLLSNTVYRELIEVSDNTQEVMLGYSDSCKDGGVFASAFGLYEAQKVIQKVSEDTGIKFRIFHGRGGSLGRGAGPAHESVMSLPPGCVNGTTKFTEQGEVITYRYANKETAAFELACGVTGLLKASHPATRSIEADDEKHLEIARTLSKMGENAYRQLTDNTEGFYDYYYEGTVVNEIALMNMGSRPVKRASGDRTKKSLRAIPWVFAWAQSRHTVPGWYGVGSALAEYCHNDPEKIMEIQQMHDSWPFFHNFVSGVQMSLFKADMQVAQEYARLCQDPITEKLVYDLIKHEFKTTQSQVLVAIQDSTLLCRQNINLRNSLEVRDTYLTPLNYIQSVLLARSRDEGLTEEERATAKDSLLRTIKAVANAIRNTG